MDSDVLRTAFDLFVTGLSRPWNYVAGITVIGLTVVLTLWWWGAI
jgi:hypothetical protein